MLAKRLCDPEQSQHCARKKAVLSAPRTSQPKPCLCSQGVGEEQCLGHVCCWNPPGSKAANIRSHALPTELSSPTTLGLHLQSSLPPELILPSFLLGGVLANGCLVPVGLPVLRHTRAVRCRESSVKGTLVPSDCSPTEVIITVMLSSLYHTGPCPPCFILGHSARATGGNRGTVKAFCSRGLRTVSFCPPPHMPVNYHTLKACRVGSL